MKGTKLIIVTGMSGTGKSSVSQNIAKQLQLNNVDCYWMHEEVENHPIREDEFSVDDIKTVEGMDVNVLDMYIKWEKLVDQILRSDKIYVMEGCYYQNIIRYFFECNYPIEKITTFYNNLMKILKPLNPTIVFLYRHDVKESFQEAFRVRGDRWKHLILNPDGDGYFNTHQYVNDDSIYEKWIDYQSVSTKMFNLIEGYKIKIDTQDHLWGQYIKSICDYLEITYVKIENSTKIDNLDDYCGKYGININGNERILEIKPIDGELYCQCWFWSNMKLIPIGNHEFDIMSFPIRLVFDIENKTIKVLGSYGWSITNKTLALVK